MPLPFLETLIAAIVWVVANVVYLDLRTKGKVGLTRLAAFWVGLPTTWIMFLVVDDQKQPTFDSEREEDEAYLLAEIRRDRALRTGADEGRAEGGPLDMTNE